MMMIPIKNELWRTNERTFNVYINIYSEKQYASLDECGFGSYILLVSQ